MAERESDPLVDSEDGRAVYMGKGWTEIRRLQRKHGPDTKDRINPIVRRDPFFLMLRFFFTLY